MPPDKIFGDLFVDVQQSGIFEDSKTFVDAIPRKAPEVILREYAHHQTNPGFSLADFVCTNFIVPGNADRHAFSKASSMETHIERLWDQLKRDADPVITGDSRIVMRQPYVVPGGRFREMYYWDSYFTMLGLAEVGRVEMIGHMVQNFSDMIEEIGHIPNGARSYFLSRSQPPFFSHMVELLSATTGSDEVIVKYLPSLLQEYAFWMDPGDLPGAHRRLVSLDARHVMNRFWDDYAFPRQESFIEDVELASKSDRVPESLYTDIRAACESGWDFSSRWLADPYDLSTIQTTSIIPVDLNCLMYSLENLIVRGLTLEDRVEEAEIMTQVAEARSKSINHYCWDPERGNYFDYNFEEQKRSEVQSMACVFPLFAGIASEEQAKMVADRIENQFLASGGLLTTTLESGQQWDAPNGWAPLQYVAYEGLCNYGHVMLAKTIARRWVDNCRRVFANTGKMMEKYNVVDLSLEAGGGEYPVQDGFGWTNGVVLKLLGKLE